MSETPDAYTRILARLLQGTADHEIAWAAVPAISPNTVGETFETKVEGETFFLWDSPVWGGWGDDVSAYRRVGPRYQLAVRHTQGDGQPVLHLFRKSRSLDDLGALVTERFGSIEDTIARRLSV